MSYIRDIVIVLKKEPFREQDRRYVMYGREHGILEAVARGAALGVSKQAGHLEPFSASEVMIAKGVFLDKLAVARLVASPYHVSERGPRLALFAICGAFADLITRLIRPGLPDARIFDLLQEVILCASEMSQDPSPARARLLYAAATLRLLDLLGFGPIILYARDAPDTDARSISILLQMMRHGPLKDMLRVTAPRGILDAASAFVEAALQHTPLDKEPHGVKTIQQLILDTDRVCMV